MSLSWNVYRSGKRPCFFAPDRMENIRHDVPDNYNIVVLTASGVPVCGRVVPDAVGTMYLDLDPGWELCVGVKNGDA
jgi:hypothetical protein